MKKYKLIKTFLKYVGRLYYYRKIDKPTFWQWLYKWRLGPGTTWTLSKIINSDSIEELEEIRKK